MSEFQHAARQQTSLLAPLEKKALLWLAANMPPWINSDHLTALGFLSMVAAGFAYWYSAVDRPLKGVRAITDQVAWRASWLNSPASP